MANICITTYALHGEQEEFDKLYKLLGKLDKKKSGVPIRNENDDVASIISYWGEESTQLDIETKWLPNPDDLSRFLNKNGIKLDFSWYAQEPGCLLFEKCDKDGDFSDFQWHIERYWIEDNPLPDCDPDLDSYTLSQLLEPITGIKDIESSVAAFNNRYGMSIFPIKEVS